MRVTTHFSTRGLAVLAFVSALAVPAAHAQQPEPTQKPKEHVVRKGDTLWDLARFYLNDPFRWPMIYEANRNVIENPHWIYPQEQLVIVIPDAPRRDTLLGVPYAEPVVVAATDAVGQAPNRSRFYKPPAEPREPTMITMSLLKPRKASAAGTMPQATAASSASSATTS